MRDSRVADAVAALAAEDPSAAVLAGQAIDEVLGGGAVDDLPLAAVDVALLRALAQGPDHLRATAAALSALLERLGRPDAAQRCRSAWWQAAAARVEEERSSLQAITAEVAAGPLNPPPLADFQWAREPGPVERDAAVLVAAALERAFLTGVLDPGRADWREAQRRIAAGVLDARSPSHDEPLSWRKAIEAERTARWRRSRSRERRQLVDAVAAAMPQQTTWRPELAATIAPVRDTVATFAAGVPAREGLPERAVVEEIAGRHGWRPPPRAGRRRWRDPADASVGLALQGGLLELGQDRITTTVLGHALASDDQALWRHVCRWGLAGFSGTEEVLWLLIVRQAEWRQTALLRAADEIAAAERLLDVRDEAGRPVRRAGTAAALEHLQEVLRTALAVAEAVHAVEVQRTGGLAGRRIRLVEPGATTLRALLRGRAVGTGTPYVLLA